jgi:transposase
MTINVDNEIVELTPELAVKIVREHRQLLAEKERLEAEAGAVAIAVAEAERLAAEAEAAVARSQAEILWLKQQLGLLKHHRFGTSSERWNPSQVQIPFNEAEVTADPEAPEPDPVIVVKRRRKQSGQRQLELTSLATEEVEYYLSEDEQVCPQCDGSLHEMGKEVRQELKVIPAQLVLVKHIRAKYACRRCQNEDISTPILTAPMPAPAFPGSLASPSAVAYIMSQKFVEGLPLYRQEQYFKRQGLELSRQTMANWMLKGADWLEPVYSAMKQTLLAGDIVCADETTLQVLREPGRKATTDSYMWLYRSGRPPADTEASTTGVLRPPIALFEYQQTRASEHAIAFLKGFVGYLCADGYQAYDKVPGAMSVGCWAHARRRFHEAFLVLPAAAQRKGNTAERIGLEYCNRLYKIEESLKECSPEERKVARLERSKPVLDEFQAWLNKSVTTVAPKSKIGQAIAYSRSQWKKLNGYLLDGRLEIDNNRSERTIKPFVIGRKNWLFANTPNGAKASAVIYSIVETAKENGLDPYAYLEFLFEKLPATTIPALPTLLPWTAAVQDALKTTTPPEPTTI